MQYLINVRAPEYAMDSVQELNAMPVSASLAGAASAQILANVASLKRVEVPPVVSHYNVAPVIDIYGSVEQRDLGGVLDDIQPLVENIKKDLPRGSDIIVRGQAETMRSSYLGLGVGLVMAIILIYFLLVVNFQSWLDPFIIITALPGALAGVVWGLFLSQTTLSVPALMGAIMSMGVATANSVLVVSFARENLAARTGSRCRRAGSRHQPHPSGVDDRARHDHRHGADEPRPRRRRRTKRAAWPRRHWRTGIRHDCHAVFCSRRFQFHAPASQAAAKPSILKP